jgi:hypothetical protein
MYKKMTSKGSEEQIKRNAAIYTPPFEKDSKEWKESGAAYIYDNETELRSSAWKDVLPGVFAVWKSDEGERKLGKESVEFLLGDHFNQARQVSQVRGPVDEPTVTKDESDTVVKKRRLEESSGEGSSSETSEGGEVADDEESSDGGQMED